MSPFYIYNKYIVKKMGYFDDLVDALKNNTIDMEEFISKLQNGLRSNTIDPKVIEDAIFNGVVHGMDYMQKKQLQYQAQAANILSKATNRNDRRMAKRMESKSKKIQDDIDFQDKHGYSREDLDEVRNARKQLTNEIVKLGESISNMFIFTYEKRIKEVSNAYAKYEKEFQSELKRASVVITTMGVGLSGIMNSNATKAQADLANKSKEEAKARIENVKTLEMANREYSVATKETQIEYANNMVDGGVAIAGAVSGIVTAALALAPATAGASAAIGGVIAAVAGIATGIKNIILNFKKVDLEAEKLANEMYEKQMEHVSQTMDQMDSFVKPFEEIVDGITELARKNEESFKKLGVQLGYGGDSYAKYMRQISVETARTFGITAEQMAEMQNSYISASGRNVMFGANDYNQMEAISRTFGIGSQEVSAMFGEMNIFNTSISDGYDMMNDMWHVATKLGISTSKFSKELTNNLKLAQKYNFKGGVENMAKLTMWAEKTRFNLQNATAFADKMMSNNISDVLETSAKLQVLGGAATMYGDPMAMMWEAGNDVGSLAKRQAAMFSDITGTFNSKTGETNFSEFDLRMIKARAEAMGMNYEDVLNQKRQSNKQGVINKALAKYGLDDELLTGIGNRATYNAKQGRFTVNTVNGEMGIDQLAQMAKNGVDVENLLLPEDTDAAIMDIAANVRSMAQKESANNLEHQTSLANAYNGEIQKASERAIENQTRLFNLTEKTGLLSGVIEHRIEVQNKKVAMLEKELNNPEVRAQVDSYYKAVENNLMSGLQLSAEQTSYLRLMAKNVDGNGADLISQYIGNAVAVKSMKDSEGKRQTAADNLFKNATTDEERIIYKSMLGQLLSTNDAIGNTNGGYMTGASVKSINDGVGTLIKTHAQDQFIAAKSGGPIDKLFDIVSNIIYKNNGNNTNSGTLEIKLSGDLNLKDNSGNINFVEIMKRDPVATREFVRILLKALDTTNNGKTSKNHMI